MSDFDESYDDTEELASYNEQDDEQSTFKDFEDISLENNFQEENDNNSTKHSFDSNTLEAVKTEKTIITPNDTNIHKAIETFQDLAQLVFDLQHISVQARAENEKLFELSKKNKVILENLEGKEKLLISLEKVTNHLSKILSSSSNIEQAVLNIPTNLSDYYTLLKEQIKQENSIYKKEFEKLIISLSSNIDMDLLSKNFNKKFSSMIENSGIDHVKASVDELTKISKEINSAIATLSDKDSGLMQNFSDSTTLLNTNLKNFNLEIDKTFKKTKIANYILIGLSSFILSSFIVFLFLNTYFNNKIESVISQKRDSIYNYYKNKIDILESENRAYQDFLKKYNTDKDSFGFSYFNDTNKPYLYFKKNLKSFEHDDKIYIPIQ